MVAARCRGQERDRKPCRFYSADNDMDPGGILAELQGSSEVEELLIVRAIKHGGQRTYGDTVTTFSVCLTIYRAF